MLSYGTNELLCPGVIYVLYILIDWLLVGHIVRYDHNLIMIYQEQFYCNYLLTYLLRR